MPIKIYSIPLSVMLKVSVGMVLFYWFLLVNFNIGALFSLHYPAIYLVASIFITILFFRRVSKGKIDFVILSLVALMWFIIATLMSGFMMDFTWDGLAYHQPATIFIANGWNPRDLDSLNELVTSINMKYGGHIGVFPNSIWIASYPKGAWEIASIFLSLGYSLDAAKMLAPVLSFVGVVLVYFYSRIRKFGRRLSLILGVIAVYSPVVISQIGSYYVDGLLGLMLLIYIFGYLNYAHTKINLFLMFPFLMVALIPSVKFTGLVYLIILSIPVLHLVFKREGLMRCLMLLLIASASLFVVCNNPYLSNYLNNGYIFYPLNVINVMDGQMPADYLVNNRFVKFIGSTYWVEGLKLRDFFRIGQTADLRVLGFGFTFGAVLIFSFVNTIKSYKQSINKYAFVVFIFTLLSVLVNPEMWWARYVPQLWFIPIISLFIPSTKKYSIRMNVILGLMLVPVTFAIINRISIETKTLIDYNQKVSIIRNNNVSIMAEQSLAANFLPSLYKRLDEIPVNIMDVKVACKDRVRIIFLDLCVEGAK
jgi:hypothetical protein